MKKLISLMILGSIVLLPLSIVGQKNMIEIIEEKDGQNIIVKAKNLSDAEIQLSLELTSKGFGLKSKEVFNEKLASKQTKTIVKLIPQANKSWSYNISSSYKLIMDSPRVSKTQETSLGKNHSDIEHKQSANSAQVNTIATLYDKNDIVVYTKNKCGRCHRTIDILKTGNISYKERNIEKNKKYHQEISTLLMENGFEGGSFSTPAIILNGKLHYNIKDLDSFVRSIVTKEKK